MYFLQKPEPLPEFSGGVLKANKFGAGCASFAPLVGEPQWSEDCLHLNVFTLSQRNQTTADDGMPVIFVVKIKNYFKNEGE